MALKRIVVLLAITLVLTLSEIAQARTPIKSRDYDEEDIDDVDDDYEDGGEYESEVKQYAQSRQDRAERRRERNERRNAPVNDREDIGDVMAHMSGSRKGAGEDLLERTLSQQAGT